MCMCTEKSCCKECQKAGKCESNRSNNHQHSGNQKPGQGHMPGGQKPYGNNGNNNGNNGNRNK